MELQKILTDFLESSKMSASSLARAIGASPALITQIKKGNYAGDVELWGKKILDFIANFCAKKIKEECENIFASKDFNMATFVANEAVNEKEIALIFGEAGSRKTTIISEFIKDKPQSILIEATCHTTAKVLLEDLCERLRLEVSGSAHKKLKAIARYLKNSEKILIVDEAEYLPLNVLEDLRRIVDFARVPLILVGTEVLYKNLMGKNKELKQLYSRICGKWMLKGLSKEESKSFYGVDFYKYTNGNFRSSAKLYKKALRLAELEEAELNDALIATASEMVIL